MHGKCEVIDTGAHAPTSSLYALSLGPVFHRLAPVLARLHDQGIRQLRGTLKVRRGRRALARLFMCLARMPKPNPTGAPCEVHLRPDGASERWTRRIDDRTLLSHQVRGHDGHIVERLGALAIHLHTQVIRGSLWQRSRFTTLFGVRLPALLGLQIVARERAIDADSFYCDVRLRSPLLGCLLHYRGVLHLVDAGTEQR